MTSPTPTPPCLGEREAVARTATSLISAVEAVRRVMHDLPVSYRMSDACPVDDLMHAVTTMQVVEEERVTLRTENETLRAERDAAIARAEEAERRHEGKFWIELREPGRVPERKGEFPISGMSKILREFMDARPTAFLTVVTIGYTGPDFQHGPEALQMADARSMERGRKHNARVREAHGDHATKTALAERDAATAKLAQAEGEIATCRTIRDVIVEAVRRADADAEEVGFDQSYPDETGIDPLLPSGDCTTLMTLGDLRAAARVLTALTTPEHPHGD